MQSEYVLVEGPKASSHIQRVNTQPASIALGSSHFDLPSPAMVREILAALPDFRLMGPSFEGDTSLLDISAYNFPRTRFGRVTGLLTLANGMGDQSKLDESTPISPVDPLVVMRTRTERVKKCPNCRGKGMDDCGWCGGDAGYAYGTMATTAKDHDDYIWVNLTAYSYSINMDKDYDFESEKEALYRCDQLTGLVELANSPEFKEFLDHCYDW
jgi:hypothetical protein